MVKKRFRNKTNRIQLVYDETGNKRELVPKGTIVLEETWGKRYSRVLEIVTAKSVSAKAPAKGAEDK